MKTSTFVLAVTTTVAALANGLPTIPGKQSPRPMHPSLPLGKRRVLCSSDSDCPSYEICMTAMDGAKVCDISLAGTQETIDKRSATTCTSDSQCPSPQRCLPGFFDSGPWSCFDSLGLDAQTIDKRTTTSCTSDSDCGSGSMCWKDTCTPIMDFGIKSGENDLVPSNQRRSTSCTSDSQCTDGLACMPSWYDPNAYVCSLSASEMEGLNSLQADYQGTG